jgi:hypothetical protein
VNVVVEPSGGTVPHYLMLIYAPSEGPPPGVRLDEQMPRWDAFTESLREAGLLVGSDRLHPVQSAKTVRVRNGETVITDGPFATTKELLGGYYHLEAPDIETVLEHARRAPHIEYGTVEVRPIAGRDLD